MPQVIVLLSQPPRYKGGWGRHATGMFDEHDQVEVRIGLHIHLSEIDGEDIGRIVGDDTLDHGGAGIGSRIGVPDLQGDLSSVEHRLGVRIVPDLLLRYGYRVGDQVSAGTDPAGEAFSVQR